MPTESVRSLNNRAYHAWVGAHSTNVASRRTSSRTNPPKAMIYSLIIPWTRGGKVIALGILARTSLAGFSSAMRRRETIEDENYGTSSLTIGCAFTHAIRRLRSVPCTGTKRGKEEKGKRPMERERRKREKEREK